MKQFLRNRKSVCILRSNPVDPDSRVEKEADALISAGYKVDIFCWDRENNYQISHSKIHNGAIDIYRKGCKASYGSGMKNFKAYMHFQFSMVSWILKNGGKYDVVHACDFDTACFSYIPTKIRHKIFVFDIFDFICGNPENLLEKLVKKAQYWLINYSDATIICTEQRREQIKGTNPKKLVIIHNSPDSNMLLSASPIAINSDKLSVVYVGVLLQNRLLKEMVNYFIGHPNINFYVGGFGLLSNYFQEITKQADNIHFLGKMSYSQTLALESSCNIMTAIYDPSIENHKYAASNKFYEALMLGKPLIMAKGTGQSEVIIRNNIGELIDFSESGFAKGMSALILQKENWERMSSRMKEIYFKNYDWKMMKVRLISLYDELLY